MRSFLLPLCVLYFYWGFEAGGGAYRGMVCNHPAQHCAMETLLDLTALGQTHPLGGALSPAPLVSSPKLLPTLR